MQPNPIKSAQIQSKPLKAIHIFPDPSKNAAIPTRIKRNLPNPRKINLYLYSKSTVILSSHPKSTRIQSNLLKSARSTQTARIHKRKSNNSNQIHQTKFKYSQTYPNPLQCAKPLKSRKQIIKIQQPESLRPLPAITLNNADVQVVL